MNDDIMGLTRLDKVMAFLSAVFTVLVLMAAGAVIGRYIGQLAAEYAVPEPVPLKVFYAVHVPDSKGWKPLPFTDRDRISFLNGVELKELPTLYYVNIYPDGSVKDGTIEYQQWYRVKR